MRFCAYFTLFFILTGMPGRAQSLELNAGYDGFLDNREYYSIDNTQTIFGSRLWGEIGTDINVIHQFRAGFNYLYEFGSDAFEHIPDVTMYYHYDTDRIDFMFGAFPRKNLLDFPLALLSDTLGYYRPNMEGIFLGYNGNNWEQQVFLDWTSRQTDDRPERFMFGFSGNVHFGMFFLEDYFIMSHLAGSGIPNPDFQSRNNGGFQINLGLDLSEKSYLDTLVLRLGTLVSLDRFRRGDPVWHTPAGFLGQLNLGYKRFGLSALLYHGAGHTFFYGDPFYRLKNYDRLDLYFMPIRNEHVNLKFGFAIHLAEGELDYSQQVLLSFKVFKDGL